MLCIVTFYVLCNSSWNKEQEVNRGTVNMIMEWSITSSIPSVVLINVTLNLCDLLVSLNPPLSCPIQSGHHHIHIDGKFPNFPQVSQENETWEVYSSTENSIAMRSTRSLFLFQGAYTLTVLIADEKENLALCVKIHTVIT